MYRGRERDIISLRCRWLASYHKTWITASHRDVNHVYSFSAREASLTGMALSQNKSTAVRMAMTTNCIWSWRSLTLLFRRGSTVKKRTQREERKRGSIVGEFSSAFKIVRMSNCKCFLYLPFTALSHSSCSPTNTDSVVNGIKSFQKGGVVSAYIKRQIKITGWVYHASSLSVPTRSSVEALLNHTENFT